MKKILSILGFISFSAVAVENDFTVKVIGVSSNSNTVFLETLESASETTCPIKTLFRVPDTDKQADRFFSLAIAAQAQGRKIIIGYNTDECLASGTLVRIFKLKHDA